MSTNRRKCHFAGHTNLVCRGDYDWEHWTVVNGLGCWPLASKLNLNFVCFILHPQHLQSFFFFSIFYHSFNIYSSSLTHSLLEILPKKGVLKLVEWFSGHCHDIKS